MKSPNYSIRVGPWRREGWDKLPKSRLSDISFGGKKREDSKDKMKIRFGWRVKNVSHTHQTVLKYHTDGTDNSNLHLTQGHRNDARRYERMLGVNRVHKKLNGIPFEGMAFGEEDVSIYGYSAGVSGYF